MCLCTHNFYEIFGVQRRSRLFLKKEKKVRNSLFFIDSILQKKWCNYLQWSLMNLREKALGFKYIYRLKLNYFIIEKLSSKTCLLLYKIKNNIYSCLKIIWYNLTVFKICQKPHIFYVKIFYETCNKSSFEESSYRLKNYLM